MPSFFQYIIVYLISDGIWYGVDVNAETIANNLEAFVWEPVVVKINMLTSASEAACLILSIDETIKNPQSDVAKGAAGNPGGQQKLRNRRG